MEQQVLGGDLDEMVDQGLYVVLIIREELLSLAVVEGVGVADGGFLILLADLLEGFRELFQSLDLGERVGTVF